MKILNPFRKLPEGYYRLFMAGWLIVPLVASILMYLLISVFGSNTNYGGGYKSWDGWDACVTWFFIFLIAYYPIARMLLWVWEGFKKDND